MDPELRRACQAALHEERLDWTKRLEAIQGDRRRSSFELSADADDQAIQRENDETLDALDRRGRDRLVAIDAALDRIAEGRFGLCEGCGDTIEAARLRAEPTAATCQECARGGRPD